VLKAATKVECFRIKPDRTNEDVKRIGGYPIVEVGKEGNKDFAGRLTSVLFTDATYEGASKKCFEPGVAVRIWTDKKETVEVIICFHCENFALTCYDAKDKVVKQDAFAPFGGTPTWRVLVKLAKEAFPDDKAIQSLNEE